MKIRVVCAAALLAVAFPVFAKAQGVHGSKGAAAVSSSTSVHNLKISRPAMLPGGDNANTSALAYQPTNSGTGKSIFSALFDGKPQATANRGGSSKYDTVISRYARSYGVPVNLAHAIIKIESNYRANARGSAGEIGLMQIKLSTARMMGYSGSRKGLYSPETNIKYGMKYLAMAHDLGGGTTCGTVLKYNAGHGAKRMNPVSARYCARVKRQLKGA
jgi:soluble lytic murein transglycosylase-like protein